jgi:hypothetical protein
MNQYGSSGEVVLEVQIRPGQRLGTM